MTNNETMIVRDKPNRGRAGITVDIKLPLRCKLTDEERHTLVLRVTQAIGENVPMDRGTVRVNILRGGGR